MKARDIIAIIIVLIYIALPFTFVKMVRLIDIDEVRYFLCHIFALIYFTILFMGVNGRNGKE